MNIRSARPSLPPSRTFAPAFAAVVMLGAAAVGCSKSSTYDQSAPPVPSNVEATTQVNRLFEGVLKKDQADLKKFLTPNFVLQRYKLEPITGWQFGDILTATYNASTQLRVDGQKFPATPSPFLSTFVRVDGEWHLVSHGNFAVPK
jgi:hypothetical protein